MQPEHRPLPGLGARLRTIAPTKYPAFTLLPVAKNQNSSSAAPVGYEARLLQMADALRGSMDAAEYKHVVLGLLLLKYISAAFDEKHAALWAGKAQGPDREDPDEYRAQGTAAASVNVEVERPLPDGGRSLGGAVVPPRD